jgi:hypothetical protein
MLINGLRVMLMQELGRFAGQSAPHRSAAVPQICYVNKGRVLQHWRSLRRQIMSVHWALRLHRNVCCRAA